jgi:cob(I)alamin adenosyltransferase
VAAAADDSLVVPYLNRLSSLLWVQARWVEGEHLLSRDVGPAGDG